MEITVQRQHPNAILPDRYQGSSVYLYAPEPHEFDIGERKCVNLGLSIGIPCEHIGIISTPPYFQSRGVSVGLHFIYPKADLPIVTGPMGPPEVDETLCVWVENFSCTRIEVPYGLPMAQLVLVKGPTTPLNIRWD